MSRDYKSRKSSKPANEKSGSAFFGGFVGYALGLASAIGVWLYLYFSPSPFLPTEKATSSSERNQTKPEILVVPEKSKQEESGSFAEEKNKFDFYKILPGIEEPETERGYPKPGELAAQPQITAKIPESNSKPEITSQPILPRPSVTPVETPQQITSLQPRTSSPSELMQQPSTVPSPKHSLPVKEKFFLQAGSFKKSDEAENLKARLALLGVFASIQSIDLADKGTWYRVRVGPFTRKEDVDETSTSLRENGIATQFIKIP